MARENRSEDADRQQIRDGDVDQALIQRAARELGVTVPVRSWNMAGDSRIALHLPYGGSVLWPPDHGTPKDLERLRNAGQLAVESPEDKPWHFEADQADQDPPPLPADNLSNHLKKELKSLARAHGFQSQSKSPRKAELVEALTWLREQLEE
jgi:hypothetical protein